MLYEQARSEDPNRREKQDELLKSAADILSCDGRSELSLRRVASSCDMSTQMVYTLFGGKRGLLTALHQEGFRRLGKEVSDMAVEEEPLAAFETLARAYRRFALEEPNLYSAMFGLNPQGFRPANASCERQTTAYGVLERIVERAADSELLRSRCTQRVADSLWAMVHGAIAMELAGYHSDDTQAEQNFIFACRAAFNGILDEHDPRDAV